MLCNVIALSLSAIRFERARWFRVWPDAVSYGNHKAVFRGVPAPPSHSQSLGVMLQMVLALPYAVAHAAPLQSAPPCYMMLYITSIWINRRRLHYTLLIHARFSYQSYFILCYWCERGNYVVLSCSTSLDCTVYYMVYYINNMCYAMWLHCLCLQ